MRNCAKDVNGFTRYRVSALVRFLLSTRQRANTLTQVVVLLFFVGFLAGCSASYQGERLFWKAQKLSTPISVDVDKATPTKFANAISAYQRVIDETPGTLWAARAQVAIGSLYALQQKFTEAREAHDLVLQNYGQYKGLALSVRVASAKSFEVEQRWDQAVAVYEDIASYHPWTQIGLEAPLYIAREYEKRGESEQATKFYKRAIRIYNKAIPDSPTEKYTLQIRGYLALAYQRLSDWDNAIETLQLLASAQADEINRPLILLTLASIYETQLENPERARRMYSLLAEEFPEHALAKAAKAKLEQLGQDIDPQQQPVDSSATAEPSPSQ